MKSTQEIANTAVANSLTGLQLSVAEYGGSSLEYSPARQSKCRVSSQIMDLPGWTAVADRAAELRARAGLGHVYYVLFQTVMEMVAKGMEGSPNDELVSVVFDDRPEHGKVKGLSSH